MTFREQYENTLTVMVDTPSENQPAASYFAGVFYEQPEFFADQLPIVLCGGGVKIDEALSLSYALLDCRMLLYTLEGEGTILIEGQRHPLSAGTLLYLDRNKCAFSLHADMRLWRFIVFTFWGGAFSRLRVHGRL